jgi:hypothetical protein
MQRATPSRILVFVPSMLLEAQRAAVLRLQAAVWDDEARVDYIRTIRLDLALGIRAVFSSRGRDNFLPKRSEQKREHQPGPNGIHAGSLRHCWVQNRASRQGAHRRGRRSSEAP